MRERPYNPPPAELIEAEARNCIKDDGGHGIISKLAAKTGIHRTTLSKGLNPEDPTPLCIWETICLLEAADSIDEEMYDGLAGIITRYMDGKRKQRAEPLDDFADLYDGLNDVTLAHIKKMPLRLQRRAVAKARRLLDQHEAYLNEHGTEENRREFAPTS